MTKKKTIYAAIIGIFLMTVLTTLIRYQNIRIDVPVSFVLFTLLSFWLCRKSARGSLALGVSLATLLFLHLSAALMSGVLPTGGIPGVIAAFLGVFSGFLLGRTLKFTFFSLAFTIVVFSISIYFPIKIYEYWNQYLL